MEAISIVLARIDLKEGMVGGIDAVWSVFIGGRLDCGRVDTRFRLLNKNFGEDLEDTTLARLSFEQ